MNTQQHEQPHIVLPATVADQLEVIRKSGETNMLDRPAVMQIANRDGYWELLDWLVEHDRGDYGRLVIYGFDRAEH